MARGRSLTFCLYLLLLKFSSAMRLDDSLNFDLPPPTVNAAAFNIIKDSALHDGDTMIVDLAFKPLVR